jgi:hypothetical protein
VELENQQLLVFNTFIFYLFLFFYELCFFQQKIANLAVAFTLLNLKVALLDADVYGPSLPILMNLKGKRPRVNERKVIIFFFFTFHFIMNNSFSVFGSVDELWCKMHEYGIFS